MSRPRRLGVATGVSLVVATAAAMTLGAVGVVATNGTSMNPVYHEDDLVVVTAADSYAVGQIVAYRDHVHDLVVLHRIVGGDPTGYELKGDNNSSVDAVRPPKADLIGRAVLRVPRAGAWLRRLAGPAPLGILAVALLTAGGAAGTRRRRRGRHLVTRHPVRRSVSPAPLVVLSPRLRTAAGATAVVAVLGLALGVLAWTTPVRTPAPGAQRVTRSMAFSYDATVPRTPAYDGVTVRSPDPVFRRLTKTVDVRLAYQGSPGGMTVDAELSTANGWHSTVPLAARKTFTTSRYDGVVRLDLPALEHRARAAAAVTGLPADQLSVAVVAHVTGSDGTSFAPSLRLTLTPLTLALADDPKTLVVQDAAAGPSELVPRTLALLGRQFAVATGRMVAAALLLAALVAALGLVLAARMTAPTSEGAAIRRRYASLLLPVHPMPIAAGHSVADVTSFVTLAKLAERYGLLVLHWSRSDVDTFLVQDAATTYRYRTGTAPIVLADACVRADSAAVPSGPGF